MSKILENLKYAKSHEWVKVDGNIATIGITDYAQSHLGNVVYLEAHDIGEFVKQFEECGVIESVKAASDILSPVSGTIIAVNDEAINAPELLNQDPYQYWIIQVELEDAQELDNLLSAQEYVAECH